jgi:hypothetical protein
MTKNKQTKRIAEGMAISERCGSMDIRFTGRRKENSYGEGQLEAGTDPDTTQADGSGREDTGMPSCGSGGKY